MDMSEIAKKLGLSESKYLIRKAAELRRLADIQFDSSIIGVGEICKAVICLEIAASRMEVIFDRQAAIRLSGVSEKAYYRSFNSMQNGIGVKNKLDIRELAIQFGCVRLIPFAHKGISFNLRTISRGVEEPIPTRMALAEPRAQVVLNPIGWMMKSGCCTQALRNGEYKERFLASLPPSRRVSTDFSRPVFVAVSFYLCAKRHKLKVDKFKLIELAGTSESEFSNVATSMMDLCFDVFGISKEKKDPKQIKGNRELLDVLPEKRRHEDGSDDDEPSAYKKRKQMEEKDHDEWKSAVLKSNKLSKTDALANNKSTKLKQGTLDFLKRSVPETAAKAS
ncbi:Origin of replication complex subunit 6 [Orobanche minor]